jgi:hypothetical protein
MLIKGHLGNGGPKKIIIDKLHFDKEQINNYEISVQQHRKAINNNEAIMNKLRSNLFEQLKYPQDTAKIDSLITVISKQQAVAEYINYNHFIEIKNLCKQTQKKDFDELTTEIANLFSPKKRK